MNSRYELCALRDGYAVIVPAYNAASTLKRALDSALAQTWPPAEVIVVDDGSPDRDGIAGIVAGYAVPIRLIQQENAGPAAARNTGIEASSSPWIAFLDADDSWLPDKMRFQLEDSGEGDVGLLHARAGENREPAPPMLDFEQLWERNRICTSTVVVRRSALNQAGTFDIDPMLVGAEDYNLWLRICKLGWKIVGTPGILAAYTPAEGSITSRIEQCAAAELYNARKLGDALSLGPALVRRKTMSIRTDFGRDLLHHREMAGARKMLGQPAFRDMRADAMKLWFVTWVPVRLLDMLRRIRRSGPSRHTITTNGG